jgi:hypothetical protein
VRCPTGQRLAIDPLFSAQPRRQASIAPLVVFKDLYGRSTAAVKQIDSWRQTAQGYGEGALPQMIAARALGG